MHKCNVPLLMVTTKDNVLRLKETLQFTSETFVVQEKVTEKCPAQSCNAITHICIYSKSKHCEATECFLYL